MSDERGPVSRAKIKYEIIQMHQRIRDQDNQRGDRARCRRILRNCDERSDRDRGGWRWERCQRGHRNQRDNMTAREMQRRSAKARWSGKTVEARRREMSALAKVRWAKTVRKPKRAARLPNKSSQPMPVGALSRVRAS